MDNTGRLRERIKKIYSPEALEEVGGGYVNFLSAYLRQSQRSPVPVFPLKTKADLQSIAADCLKEGDRNREENLQDNFAKLSKLFLQNAHRLHSPHYMGHQISPPVPMGALFDGLASFTNQGLAVGEMGPFATAIERSLIRELGHLIGWEGKSFDGVATGGGTVANLTALLAARNHRYGDVWETGRAGTRQPAIIASADAHYSISRAAGVLGIGTRQVIKAPLDDKRRLDVEKLPTLIEGAAKQGLDVFCLVASSPSTPIGAFDRLSDMAVVAKKYGIWFHVDGAHGASVLFSEKHRSLVAGIEEADSVTWDAHKMLFVPALSTYLLFKDERNSWGSFHQEAPYLFGEADGEQMRWNGGLRTLECTKRGLSVALWGIWSLYGRGLFSDLVDLTFQNAQEAYEMLSADTQFEVIHKPQSNIICFRHKPFGEKCLSAHQILTRKVLLEIGDFYVTMTTLEGVAALRLTLMNPLTGPADLGDLFSLIKNCLKNCRV